MENSNSRKWLKPGSRQCLIRRGLVKSMGYTDADLEKPIVGIINTGRDQSWTCQFQATGRCCQAWCLPDAGGFPLEINTMSICEVFSIFPPDLSGFAFDDDKKEMIARHPFDGVVLLGNAVIKAFLLS